MSRPESQAPSGRKRSNTVQSSYGNTSLANSITLSAPPLKVGDSRILTAWVNEPISTTVKLNHKHWPGVQEGDLICITSPMPEHGPGFLFVVPTEDINVKHQLQVRASACVNAVRVSAHVKISLPRPVLEKFGLRSNSEVTLTKVSILECIWKVWSRWCTRWTRKGSAQTTSSLCSKTSIWAGTTCGGLVVILSVNVCTSSSKSHSLALSRRRCKRCISAARR